MTIILELEALPRPFVDRATVEFLLGVGRRRAQQILAPCVTERVGANGLADRDALIDRLRRLSQGDDGFYEVERRRKVAHVLEQLRQTRLEGPQLLVEAPVAVVNRELKDLPAGIHIEAGRITIEFEQPQDPKRRHHRGLHPLLSPQPVLLLYRSESAPVRPSCQHWKSTTARYGKYIIALIWDDLPSPDMTTVT